MFSKQAIDRLIALHDQIEAGKEHQYAAPTYKDRPALMEMEQILFSNTEESADVLCEKIAVLRYLAMCYDDMCRTGVSIKFHNKLIETHAKLSSLEAYSDEDMELFEEDFYNAVKARNLYNRDDCKDLGSMLKGILPKEKIDEILSSAIKRCSYLPKKDPVELTERYLSVIDAVEQKIDRNMTIGICHEYWALKARYLKELGINWSSPAVLNPSVMFD